MALDPDLPPDLGDLAFPINQVGRPFDPHIFAAIQILFDPNTISLAQRPVLVRN